MAYDTTAYNEWLTPTTGYNAGGPQRLGTSASPTGGYTYKPGQSGGSFVQDNVRNDLTKGRPLPPPGMRAFGGYRAFKKAQSAQRMEQQSIEGIQRNYAARAPTEYLGAIDPTSKTYQMARQRGAGGAAQAMSTEELQAGLRQEGQETQRAGFSKQIEEYFGGADRAGWQQSIVSNRLNNDLANVAEDYGNNLRSSVQGSAARGIQGGSVDVENRGAVARTRDTGAIQAASQADATTAGFRNQDQQARSQLLGLVNSQDIGSAEGVRNALQNISSQTVAQGAQYAAGQQQRQIHQFGQQQQSQAWGGGLQGLATAINQNPNRGNSLGAWYGSNSKGGW